ncbi:acyltransferase family protein [Spirillospora sp. CA-253888]
MTSSAAPPLQAPVPAGPPVPPGGARPARPRLAALDLLRFVAAGAVMMFHFTATTKGDWGVPHRELFPGMEWAVFGQYGVDLFFVISGFVILMSVWGRRPGDFAVSRVSRLMPAYWFSVVLALVVFLATGIGPNEGGKSAVSMVERFLPNLTMMQNGAEVPPMEGLYWTLWVELHFYALISLLVWRGVTYARCMGFMTAWLLLGLFAQEAGFKILQSLLMPEWAPYFIAGMAFYLIYTYGSNIMLWLMVGACWALSTHFAVKHVNRDIFWPGVHEAVVPVVITMIFAAMALVATHRLARVNWRGCTWLGALTYPLYLVHLTVTRPVIEWLRPSLDQWTILGIMIAVALLSAYLIQRLVEKPGQRWLNRQLKQALAQIRAASPAPAGAAATGSNGQNGRNGTTGKAAPVPPVAAAGPPFPDRPLSETLSAGPETITSPGGQEAPAVSPFRPLH